MVISVKKHVQCYTFHVARIIMEIQNSIYSLGKNRNQEFALEKIYRLMGFEKLMCLRD